MIEIIDNDIMVQEVLAPIAAKGKDSRKLENISCFISSIQKICH